MALMQCVCMEHLCRNTIKFSVAPFFSYLNPPTLARIHPAASAGESLWLFYYARALVLETRYGNNFARRLGLRRRDVT